MSIRRVALWHRTYPFGRIPTLTQESAELAGCISTASKDCGGLVDWPRASSNRRETMPSAFNMAGASAVHSRTPRLRIPDVHTSDERSLLGTSLAAESSLFRHPGEVYFRATACFDLHSLYTRAFASFLESVNPACVRRGASSSRLVASDPMGTRSEAVKK